MSQFLAIATGAALLGLGGIIGASAGIAEIILYIFLILFVAGPISRVMRGAWRNMGLKGRKAGICSTSGGITNYPHSHASAVC